MEQSPIWRQGNQGILTSLCHDAEAISLAMGHGKLPNLKAIGASPD